MTRKRNRDKSKKSMWLRHKERMDLIEKGRENFKALFGRRRG